MILWWHASCRLLLFSYLHLFCNSSNIIHLFVLGIYDSDLRIFTLNFRGLSFTFPVEQASEPKYTNKGLGSLQFSNGASPVASKMFIFNGNSLNESKPPALPISCFFSHPYLQWLEVIRRKGCTSGVRLSIICEGTPITLSSHYLYFVHFYYLYSIFKDLKFLNSNLAVIQLLLNCTLVLQLKMFLAYLAALAEFFIKYETFKGLYFKDVHKFRPFLDTDCPTLSDSYNSFS